MKTEVINLDTLEGMSQVAEYELIPMESTYYPPADGIVQIAYTVPELEVYFGTRVNIIYDFNKSTLRVDSIERVDIELIYRGKTYETEVIKETQDSVRFRARLKK